MQNIFLQVVPKVFGQFVAISWKHPTLVGNSYTLGSAERFSPKWFPIVWYPSTRSLILIKSFLIYMKMCFLCDRVFSSIFFSVEHHHWSCGYPFLLLLPSLQNFYGEKRFSGNFYKSMSPHNIMRLDLRKSNILHIPSELRFCYI